MNENELNESPSITTTATCTDTVSLSDPLAMAPNENDSVVEEPDSNESEYASASILGKIKIRIKLAIEWALFCIKQTLSFIFTKPNSREGLFQFILRQFMLSDSKGNPSWTITILVFVMLLIAYVTHYSTVIALSQIATLDPTTGKVIGTCLKGYATEFWYLIISLAVVITTAFNAKSAAQQAADTGVEPTGIVSKIISAAGNVISQIKGVPK